MRTDEMLKVQSVHDDLTAEIKRLRNLLRLPLSSAELKLVDKHCDWLGFGHAWNAIIKRRLAALDEYN